MIKSSLLSLALITYAAVSSAYCYDDMGNSYSVRKIGNTTYVDGSNLNTGF